MTTSVRAEILLALKDEFTKPMAQAGQATKVASGEIKQGFGSAIQTLTGFNVASLSVAGAIGGLAAGIKYAVEQAAEAQRIFAITEAVVKSTGGAAGLTADEIANMAGRLSELNAVDDEVIQSAQNVLLTFKKIKGEAFEEASQAAIDLSVVMGGDLRSSMMMIGKALEDPIRGITALRRAGVSFTADQQKLIKELVETGRQAEAMNIILTEVNTQVGGAGAAAAETYTGKMNALKIAADNTAQAFGERLLPALIIVADNMGDWLTLNNKVDQAVQDNIVTEQERRNVLEAVRRGFLTSAAAQEYLNEKTEEAAEAMRDAADNTQDYAIRLAQADRTTGDIDASTNDLALSYARMGAAAQQGSMEALVGIGALRAETDKLNDAMLQQAVDAGLDGTLTRAWEDYQGVLAETQPEIDKLRADIERMNAAHGQTWTVVNEAQHSVEEYELAQIKAATAAQKLAEFTGDSREEYLNLKIAADNAAASVAEMGGEMGLTQQFTADYTKKLMEANGSLSELEAKQMAAEEALRRTTAEFIYQQLAVDGDAEANLTLARNLGLMDEASYQASLALLHLKQRYEDDALSLDNYGKLAGLAADAILRLQDKNITVTITTVYEEIHRQQIQDATMAAGGQGGGVSDGIYDPKPGQAMGGPVMGGQSYIVGEQGPEVFTPATSGAITPNHHLGGGVTIGNISITVPGGDAREISRQLAGELRRALTNGAGYLGA